MSVTYKKLFHRLIEEDLSQPQFQRLCGFSGNILTRLRGDKYVSMESIETICNTLNCKVDDILEFTNQHDINVMEKKYENF